MGNKDIVLMISKSNMDDMDAQVGHVVHVRDPTRSRRRLCTEASCFIKLTADLLFWYLVTSHSFTFAPWLSKLLP